MPTVKVYGKEYEVPIDIYMAFTEMNNAMEANYANADALYRELEELRRKVREWQQLETVAKKEPFKANRIAAWEKKEELFNNISVKSKVFVK